LAWVSGKIEVLRRRNNLSWSHHQEVASLPPAEQDEWLNYGEKHYGETYAQAIEVSDKEYQTLADAARVAGNIEFTRRRVNLSWSHHQEVANNGRQFYDQEAKERMLSGKKSDPGSNRTNVPKVAWEQPLGGVRGRDS